MEFDDLLADWKKEKEDRENQIQIREIRPPEPIPPFDLTVKQKRAIIRYVCGVSAKSICEDLDEFQIDVDDWDSVDSAIYNFLTQMKNHLLGEI